MFDNDWDDNIFPLAYLLTFRTYGTWLHGDKRGLVDTHNRKNVYGAPDISPNKNLENLMQKKMKDQQFLLDEIQRKSVELAIEEFCQHKNFQLHAVNARTNHVHAVISAQTKPELIINFSKSYSTRKLRELKLISNKKTIWSRGGSRRYLWKERHVSLAIEYVLYGQDDVPFEIED
ncbi:MAG TPA: transposase [Pyrinomonadaceae bacterium]|nr:transposase [Pyrinomonadaceae bacterium]